MEAHRLQWSHFTRICCTFNRYSIVMWCNQRIATIGADLPHRKCKYP